MLRAVYGIVRVLPRSQCAGWRRLSTGLCMYQRNHELSHTHSSQRSRSLIENDGSEGYGGRKQHQYHERFDTCKKIGALITLAGMTVVYGLGSALCEGQEKNETVKSIKEEIDRNKDKPEGKDVVGTEIRENMRVDCENGVQKAIKHARKLLKRRMEEAGAPGLVVAVSVDGETVWADGLGFADLENSVRCSPNTVMRIASISKSLTMTAVARLWEDSKLNLDAPVQKYVPCFPVKKYDGEEVTITTRHLLSHQSGIRHYKLKDPSKKKKENLNCESSKTKCIENKEKSKEERDIAQQCVIKKEEGEDSTEKKDEQSAQVIVESKKAQLEKLIGKKAAKKKKKKKDEEEYEFDLEEYYLKETFDTVKEALQIFQDDELFFKPGNGYLYTTHGWTLVSGVVEAAAGKPFTQVITQLFHDLGMDNTYLDRNTPIIYNRARYYIRDQHGRLQNAPYVDNSYKWAGGGFLSTVQDLNKFGNAMLYASQHTSQQGAPGFLKSSTMKELWAPVHGTNMAWDRDGYYGLGWGTVEPKVKYGFCRESRTYVSHTGGAVGASSVLLILPHTGTNVVEETPPKGVVVSIISNMQGVGLNKVALQIAKAFEEVL